MLTGYSEFEYAKSAMQYSVRHYLIKPTDESQIIQALTELSTEIDQKQSHKKLFTRLVRDAPANLFRELLTRTDMSEAMPKEDFLFFQNVLNLREGAYSLALIQLEATSDALMYFALENISSDILPKNAFICSTTVNDHLFLLLCDLDIDAAERGLSQIMSHFRQFYGHSVSATLSSSKSFEEIGVLYREVLENHVYHYYLPPFSVLTPAMVHKLRSPLASSLIYENPDIKLNELCQKTGFANNPAHFSTCFKNYFQCTLTQYRQKLL